MVNRDNKGNPVGSFASIQKAQDKEHRAAQQKMQHEIETRVKAMPSQHNTGQSPSAIQTGAPQASHFASVTNNLDDTKHYPEDMKFAKIPNGPKNNAGSFVANVSGLKGV